jgi:hypothetical protein
VWPCTSPAWHQGLPRCFAVCWVWNGTFPPLRVHWPPLQVDPVRNIATVRLPCHGAASICALQRPSSGGGEGGGASTGSLSASHAFGGAVSGRRAPWGSSWRNTRVQHAYCGHAADLRGQNMVSACAVRQSGSRLQALQSERHQLRCGLPSPPALPTPDISACGDVRGPSLRLCNRGSGRSSRAQLFASGRVGVAGERRPGLTLLVVATARAWLRTVRDPLLRTPTLYIACALCMCTCFPHPTPANCGMRAEAPRSHAARATTGVCNCIAALTMCGATHLHPNVRCNGISALVNEQLRVL